MSPITHIKSAPQESDVIGSYSNSTLDSHDRHIWFIFEFPVIAHKMVYWMCFASKFINGWCDWWI